MPSSIVTVIKRELLSSLRSWKSLFLMLFLMAILYYYIFQLVDAMWVNTFGVADSMQQLFGMQVYLLLFAAMSIVPASAAVSICKERSDESYDLLATTLIPPSRIVVGKFFATLIVFLLTTIALLPFTGLIFFFAGVDLYRFFQAAIVLLSVAVTSAALGIWISTLLDNLARAIFFSFGLVLLVNLGLPATLAWLDWDPRLLALLTPFGLLGDSIAQTSTWGNYAAFAAYQGIFAVLAIAGAIFNLGRARILAPVGDLIQKSIPKGQSRLFRPMADRKNPITVRESYRGSRPRTRLIVFCLALFLYGYVLYSGYEAARDPYVLFVPIYVERLLLLALVPPVVAVSFVRDTEETTWDMLRLTLLSPLNVVSGKLWGVGWTLFSVLGPIYIVNILVLLFLAMVYGARDDYFWSTALAGELIFFPLHALLIATTAMMGVVFTRKITTAVAAAYGSTIICMFLFLMLQAQMAFGMAGPDSIIAVGLGHLILSAFALFVAGGVVMARVNHLWENFFAGNPSSGTVPSPIPPADE